MKLNQKNKYLFGNMCRLELINVNGLKNNLLEIVINFFMIVNKSQLNKMSILYAKNLNFQEKYAFFYE